MMRDNGGRGEVRLAAAKLAAVTRSKMKNQMMNRNREGLMNNSMAEAGGVEDRNVRRPEEEGLRLENEEWRVKANYAGSVKEKRAEMAKDTMGVSGKANYAGNVKEKRAEMAKDTMEVSGSRSGTMAKYVEVNEGTIGCVDEGTMRVSERMAGTIAKYVEMSKGTASYVQVDEIRKVTVVSYENCKGDMGGACQIKGGGMKYGGTDEEKAALTGKLKEVWAIDDRKLAAKMRNSDSGEEECQDDENKEEGEISEEAEYENRAEGNEDTTKSEGEYEEPWHAGCQSESEVAAERRSQGTSEDSDIYSSGDDDYEEEDVRMIRRMGEAEWEKEKLIMEVSEQKEVDEEGKKKEILRKVIQKKERIWDDESEEGNTEGSEESGGSEQKKAKRTMKRMDRRNRNIMNKGRDDKEEELLNIVKGKLDSKNRTKKGEKAEVRYIAEIADEDSWPAVEGRIKTTPRRSKESVIGGIRRTTDATGSKNERDVEMIGRCGMNETPEVMKKIMDVSVVKSNVAGRTRARTSMMTANRTGKMEAEKRRQRMLAEEEIYSAKDKGEALRLMIEEGMGQSDDDDDDKAIQMAINDSLGEARWGRDDVSQEELLEFQRELEKEERGQDGEEQGGVRKQLKFDDIKEKVIGAEECGNETQDTIERKKKKSAAGALSKVTVEKEKNKSAADALRRDTVEKEKNKSAADALRKGTVEKEDKVSKRVRKMEGDMKEMVLTSDKRDIPINERVEEAESTNTPQEKDMMRYLRHREGSMQVAGNGGQEPEEVVEREEQQNRENERENGKSGDKDRSEEEVRRAGRRKENDNERSRKSWCRKQEKTEEEISKERQKLRKVNNPFLKMSGVTESAYELIMGESRMRYEGHDADGFLRSIGNKLVHSRIRNVQYHALGVYGMINYDHWDDGEREKKQIFYGPVLVGDRTKMSVFSCVGTREAVMALQKEIVCLVQLRHGGPQIERLWIDNYFEWDMWEFGKNIGDGVLIEQLHEQVMMKKGYTMMVETTYTAPGGIVMGNLPFNELMLDENKQIGAELFALQRQRTGLYDWFRVYNVAEMKNDVIQDYEIVEFLPMKDNGEKTKYICMVKNVEGAIVHEFQFGKEQLLYSVVGRQLRKHGVDMWIDNYMNPIPMGGEVKWKGKALDRRESPFTGDMLQRKGRYVKAGLERNALLKDFDTDLAWGEVVAREFRNNCDEERLNGVALWVNANELIVALLASEEMDDVRVETTLEGRPGRFQWWDWPWMHQEGVTQDGVRMPVQMPTLYSIRSPDTKQKVRWWWGNVERKFEVAKWRLQMLIAVKSREFMTSRIENGYMGNQGGVRIIRMEAGRFLELYRHRWEATEQETWTWAHMWTYDAELVKRLRDVNPLFELRVESLATVNVKEGRRYFFEYPWIRGEMPTLYSFIDKDTEGTRKEKGGNKDRRINVIGKKGRGPLQDKEKDDGTRHDMEEDKRIAGGTKTPSQAVKGEDSEGGRGQHLSMKKARRVVDSEKKVFEDEDNKNMTIILRERRIKETTGREVKSKVKRVPFCTTQLFNMGDHHEITLEVIGRKWENADELKRYMLDISGAINQVMTITSNNIDDAADMTIEQLEAEECDRETREAWSQFAMCWKEVHRLSKGLYEFITTRCMMPSPRSSVMRRYMEEAIMRMRQGMDWIGANNKFMPLMIRVYTRDTGEWLDIILGVLCPMREYLMQKNVVLTKRGDMALEVSNSEDEESTVDDEDDESSNETGSSDDDDDEDDDDDRRHDGHWGLLEDEQDEGRKDGDGYRGNAKRRRSPNEDGARRVKRKDREQDVVARAPLEQFAEGNVRDTRSRVDQEGGLVDRLQESIFHTGSLLDIMEGRVDGNARYLSRMDVQREETDTAEVNRSKNAWLQVDKEWLRVRENLLELSEYLKIRELEVLVGDDLRVAIGMMNRNNMAILRLIREQSHVWPEFISDTADEVGTVIEGMRVEWEELRQRSARNKLAKVVSPIAFMRRQAETVKELVQERGKRQREDMKEGVMVTGVPRVKEADNTRRRIVFQTSGQGDNEAIQKGQLEEFREFLKFKKMAALSANVIPEIEDGGSEDEQLVMSNVKGGKQVWDGIMEGKEWDDPEVDEIYERYKNGGQEERRLITEFIRKESMKLEEGLWEKLEGVIKNGDSFEVGTEEQGNEGWLTKEEKEVQSFFVECDLPWGYSCAKPQIRERGNARFPCINDRTMKRYVQNMPLREDVVEIQTMESGEFTSNAEVNVFSATGDGRQLPLTQFRTQKYYEVEDDMDHLYIKLCLAANARMSIAFEYEVARREFFNQVKSENVIHLTQMHDTEGLAVIMVTIIEGNEKVPRLIPLPRNFRELISEQFVKEKVSRCAYFPNVRYKALYQPSGCFKGCVDEEVVVRSRSNRARPKYMSEIVGEWLGSERREQSEDISRVPAMMMLNVGGEGRRNEPENVKRALHGLLGKYYDNRRKTDQRTSTPMMAGESSEGGNIELNPEELASVRRMVEEMAVVTKRKHGMQAIDGGQVEQGTSGISINGGMIQTGSAESARGDNMTTNSSQRKCPAIVKQFYEMYKDKRKIGRASKVDCTDTFRLNMEKVDAVFEQIEDITEGIKIFILMQLLDTDATAIAKELKEEVRKDYGALKEALMKELGDELKVMELQNRLANMRQTEKQSVTDFYRTCRDPLNRIYNRLDFPNDEVRNQLMMQKFVAALYYDSTKAYLIGSGIDTVMAACEKADKYEYNMKLCSQASKGEVKDEESTEFRTVMQQQLEEIKRVQAAQMNQFMMEKAAKQAVGGLVAKGFTPVNAPGTTRAYGNKPYVPMSAYQNKTMAATASQYQNKKPFVDYRNQARPGGFQRTNEAVNKGNNKVFGDNKVGGNDVYAKKANGNCVECDARQGHTSYCSKGVKRPSMAMMGNEEEEMDDVQQGYERYVHYLRFREEEQREIDQEEDEDEGVMAVVGGAEEENEKLTDDIGQLSDRLDAHKAWVESNRNKGAAVFDRLMANATVEEPRGVNREAPMSVMTVTYMGTLTGEGCGAEPVVWETDSSEMAINAVHDDIVRGLKENDSFEYNGGALAKPHSPERIRIMRNMVGRVRSYRVETNGVWLDFLYDTGAAMSTISAMDAQKLHDMGVVNLERDMKNWTIGCQDFLGSPHKLTHVIELRVKLGHFGPVMVPFACSKNMRRTIMGTNMQSMLFGEALWPQDPLLRPVSLQPEGTTAMKTQVTKRIANGTGGELQKKCQAMRNPDINIPRLESGKIKVTTAPEESKGQKAQAYYENPECNPQTGGGGKISMISCGNKDELEDVTTEESEDEGSKVCFWNPVEDMMRPGIFCLVNTVTIMPGQGRRVRAKLERGMEMGVKVDEHMRGMKMAYQQDKRSVSMMAEPIPFVGMMRHEKLELQTSVTELTRSDDDIPCMLMNNGTLPITLKKGMKIARATPVYTPEELMKDEDWVKLVNNKGGKDFRRMLLVKMRAGNMV